MKLRLKERAVNKSDSALINLGCQALLQRRKDGTIVARSHSLLLNMWVLHPKCQIKMQKNRESVWQRLLLRPHHRFRCLLVLIKSNIKRAIKITSCILRNLNRRKKRRQQLSPPWQAWMTKRSINQWVLMGRVQGCLKACRCLLSGFREPRLKIWRI